MLYNFKVYLSSQLIFIVKLVGKLSRYAFETFAKQLAFFSFY